MEMPSTYRQIVGVRTALSCLKGSPFSTESSGGSVAKANAAKVSMIRLIQRSWAAERGDSARKNEPTAIVIRAERLTVNWNCKNLPTL